LSCKNYGTLLRYIEDNVGGMPIIRATSEIASTVMLIAAECLSSASQRNSNFRGE
jgi:alanine dehydrogenase